MDKERKRSIGGNKGTATATTTPTPLLPSSVVAAGSVWESRMKIDEVRGGFRVFNGAEIDQTSPTKPKRNSLPNTPKRKTWKPETISDGVRSPIQAHNNKKIVRSEISSPIIASRRIAKPKSNSPPKSANSNVVVVVDDNVEETKEENEEEKIQVCEDQAIVDEDLKSDEDDHDVDDVDDDDESIEVEIKEEVKEVEKNAEKKEIVLVSEVKRVNFVRKLEVRDQIDNKHNNNNNNNNSINNNVRKVFHQNQKHSEPISLSVKRQSPVIKRATVHSSFASNSHPNSDAYNSFPESHNRLQSFVDLIMWKDISRSVFIFGIGTFTILSSSYTKDLNISFISVISYLCLVYLAAIFLFRSIVCRGVIDMDYTRYVLGEEEAIWLLKLVLPYLNEFLLKLKALFSGDPATTMKLATLLFILARCGSSITIWTMAKLGFFGVFTVPKVCSLYSTHITAYANFWVRRFRDAWDSCSHKKGVTVAVFMLVWNLSSIIARIWAVFMLFVAFRYYQQNLVAADWEEDGPDDEETWEEPIGTHKNGPEPKIVDHTKEKKRL